MRLLSILAARALIWCTIPLLSAAEWLVRREPRSGKVCHSRWVPEGTP